MAAVAAKALESPTERSGHATGLRQVSIQRCPGVAPGPSGVCPCHEDLDNRPAEVQGAWNDTPARNRSAASQAIRDVTSRAGTALPDRVRIDMERRFDASFVDVRVHTDSAAAESVRSMNARAYTTGNHIVFGDGVFAPYVATGRRILAHELSHVLQQRSGPVSGIPMRGGLKLSCPGDEFEREADARAAAVLAGSEDERSPPRPVSVRPPDSPLGGAGEHNRSVGSSATPEDCTVLRLAFGGDGALTPRRQGTVQAAARIAERVADSHEFEAEWNQFWTGPAKSISPRPTLAAYRAALSNRVVHDLDTSSNPAVREIMAEERAMPLERQTGGVTRVGSKDTYLRQFAIDQGVDGVVSLLLHESIHGAGVPMGPAMIYEPFLHGFEAAAGFPLMMGGADITSIRQVRRGNYDLDLDVDYNIRRIDVAPIPANIEIQVVSQETGEMISEESDDAGRRPVRKRLQSRSGHGSWHWRARYVGLSPLTVRIVEADAANMMASRSFTPNPRCVLGVSTVHCDEG